jgi:hypothetical protein
MRPEHELEIDIAAWVEEQGFYAVLDALQTTCRYWATAEEEPPIEGPPELWAARESDLGMMLWKERCR